MAGALFLLADIGQKKQFPTSKVARMLRYGQGHIAMQGNKPGTFFVRGGKTRNVPEGMKTTSATSA